VGVTNYFSVCVCVRACVYVYVTGHRLLIVICCLVIGSPIRRKREERKQRTEEMIRKMREKQIAAELLQESPWWRSRSLWIGAATAAAVLAVGIIYLH